MSYEKLNLINGEKFSAEHVSHIEDGIVQNALDAEAQINQIKGDLVNQNEMIDYAVVNSVEYSLLDARININSGYYDFDGVLHSLPTARRTEKIKVEPFDKFKLTLQLTTSTVCAICEFDENNIFLRGIQPYRENITITDYEYTPSNDCKYVAFTSYAESGIPICSIKKTDFDMVKNSIEKNVNDTSMIETILDRENVVIDANFGKRSDTASGGTWYRTRNLFNQTLIIDKIKLEVTNNTGDVCSVGIALLSSNNICKKVKVVSKELTSTTTIFEIDLGWMCENGDNIAICTYKCNGYFSTSPYGLTSLVGNHMFVGDTVTDDANIAGYSIEFKVECHKFVKSKLQSKLSGKKWAIIGDSINEYNATASKNWIKWMIDETGVNAINLAVGGKGFCAGYENGTNYISRISSIPTDADIITVAVSFNDLGNVEKEVGTINDSGTDTLCSYINAFFDELLTQFPLATIGVYTTSPWLWFRPNHAKSEEFIDAIRKICRYRGIPFFDECFYNSGLRPFVAAFRTEYFHEADGIHPNDKGHKFLYPKLRPFIEGLLTNY